MQSSSADKQGPDKEPMSYNDAAEQILTLARICAELQDPEQTKAQLLQARFGEDDIDLRGGDTKSKYRIIIKNLLDEDFRKNLLAASVSLVSKPEKRTHAQQVAEMAMDAKIKLKPKSQKSDSIDLTDDIEQTPNSESSSQQPQSASRKRFRKKTIKTMQEQIGEDLGVDMSKQKQFSCTDRQGINWEATKYRWTGNEIPIKIQQGKINIEKGEQYGYIMTALSASQSTALTAYAKSQEGKPNADECKHIFKLSTIGANAVTQLRVGINLPQQFKVVAGNNVLPSDIITEDTMERIKKYAEQKNLKYLTAATAMQYSPETATFDIESASVLLIPGICLNLTSDFCNFMYKRIQSTSLLIPTLALPLVKLQHAVVLSGFTFSCSNLPRDVSVVIVAQVLCVSIFLVLLVCTELLYIGFVQSALPRFLRFDITTAVSIAPI
ncbi:MAG: hypothetical protein EZS28_032903 [Streblomastix strix]|uniref:Uncharacterized protein n=1 Tax=Streblomastix strix TaxID=222440 RepID=A0A5J4UNL6_9EUKA|nr:MAG: hypothetical protein EZS28_032903 [Streblomastix strix]